MRDRRGGGPDYVNLMAGFYVWRAVAKVIGAIGAIIFIAVYLILYSVAPAEAPDIAAGAFFALMVVGFGVIVFVVFRLIFAAFQRPPSAWERQVAMDRKMNWISNPPPGVSFFRENGEKKQYDHSTGAWS